MRRQELQWKSSRRETQDEYLGRLRRTATRLPRSFLDDRISDMARRRRRLHEANGWALRGGWQEPVMPNRGAIPSLGRVGA